MDKFLTKLTGGALAGAGASKLEKSPTLPFAFVWSFSREHLHQSLDKVGINVNEEQRIVEVTADSLASAANVQPHRYFVAMVNGQAVDSPAGFWDIVKSTLDVKVVLCEASPIDELLTKISVFKKHHHPQQQQQQHLDDEFAVDSSPMSSSIKMNANNGEPDYQALMSNDATAKKYGFLKLSHPLYNLWEQLRAKAVKARDALGMLDAALQEEERKVQEAAAAAALKLLDSDDDQSSSDSGDGAGSSDEDDDFGPDQERKERRPASGNVASFFAENDDDADDGAGDENRRAAGENSVAEAKARLLAAGAIAVEPGYRRPARPVYFSPHWHCYHAMGHQARVALLADEEEEKKKKEAEKEGVAVGAEPVLVVETAGKRRERHE